MNFSRVCLFPGAGESNELSRIVFRFKKNLGFILLLSDRKKHVWASKSMPAAAKKLKKHGRLMIHFRHLIKIEKRLRKYAKHEKHSAYFCRPFANSTYVHATLSNIWETRYTYAKKRDWLAGQHCNAKKNLQFFPRFSCEEDFFFLLYTKNEKV